MENETLIDFPRLREVLKDLADDIGRNYADTLRRNHRPTRENTLASCAEDATLHKVTAIAGGFEITFDLPSYWKYVEHGTRPHWPPSAAIQRWVEIKPIIPYPDSRGRIPSPKQLAFLISRKIANEGTRGTSDLETARRGTLAWYSDRIKSALLEDSGAFIAKVYTGPIVIEAKL